MAKVEEYLRAHNLKMTPQRRLVIRKLLSARRHLSAEEIVDMLKRDGAAVSRATVYRLLGALRDSKLIDAHSFDQRYRVYEPAVGKVHHDHLYCLSCGKIIEFQSEGIERLQERVCRRHRFVEVYHSHKIFGYCAGCRSGRRRPQGRGVS